MSKGIVKTLLLALVVGAATYAEAQGTAFIYHGQLTQKGQSPNGERDLRFGLFDNPTSGTAIATLDRPDVPVRGGAFTVTLDFGNAFDGNTRWLEISVRNKNGQFVTLKPRQKFMPTPYAIMAGSASNLLGTLPASQISGQILASQISGSITASQFTGSIPATQITGLIPASQLTGALPSSLLSGTYSSPLKFENPANSFSGNGSGLTGVDASTINGLSATNFWKLGGNAGTIAGTNFLGTTDDQALELKANNQRILRLEPNSESPNLIGGRDSIVGFSARGITIGGGAEHWISHSRYAVIGGGQSNIIGFGHYATIGGGLKNSIERGGLYGSTIAGGISNNISGMYNFNTIGGGIGNNMYSDSGSSVIGGGEKNGIHERLGFIGGGSGNFIDWGGSSVIGGGSGNYIGSYPKGSGNGTIGGGAKNVLRNGNADTIGGGRVNFIDGVDPGTSITARTIAGGEKNSIAQQSIYSAIGGGSYNSISSNSFAATVAGGGTNLIDTRADFAVIGGGGLNTISTNADAGTIAGGVANMIERNVFWASIGGGSSNRIRQGMSGSSYSVISGGSSNQVFTPGASIGGGMQNTIGTFNGSSSEIGHTIGGGVRNSINYDTSGGATISGGEQNYIGTSHGTIAGGNANRILWSQNGDSRGNAIGGGVRNAIQPLATDLVEGLKGYSVIGGGWSNFISGSFGVVPGGLSNSVAGAFGFAAGRRATAKHDGAFVWADSSNSDFPSSSTNSFSVRATGGTRFVSAIDAAGNPTAGVELPSGGGAWATLSDRDSKENLAVVNPREVLERVAQMPISTWNYKSQDNSVRHIGPMAQDFAAAFQVGEDSRRITTVDADGVALAAIQGLNQVVKEKDAEIQELKQRLEKLEKLMSQTTGGEK